MTIQVNLDSKTFKNFTCFDILKRRKLWKAPVMFAAILSVSAIICFIMHKVDGAILLGSVLLAVGLGMPIVYFVTFFLSLKKQTEAQNLTPPRIVYTLDLTQKPDGIFVSNGTNSATYKWNDVYRAYFNHKCAYLYITKERAFLLPYSNNKDDLCNLLLQMLGEERCKKL